MTSLTNKLIGLVLSLSAIGFTSALMGWQLARNSERSRVRLMLRDSAERAVQGKVNGTEELVRLYNEAEIRK